MGKVRQITDKNWKQFEKGRAGKGMTEDQYLEFLLSHQSNKDLMKAMKSDLTRCVNEFGELDEKYRKLKKENKKLRKDLKNAITITEE